MKDYIVYKCKVCHKYFILLTEEVRMTEEKGDHITCPHKGHRDIIVTGAYDSIKECMSHSSYKRDKGSMRQIK